MNLRRWLCSLALLGPLGAFGVQLGDTREAVIAEFGQPVGQIELGDRERLLFTEGDIDLVDGRVASVSIKTAEELALDAARRARQAEARAAWLAENERQRLADARDAVVIAQAGNTTSRELDLILRRWQLLRRDYPDAVSDAEFAGVVATIQTRMADVREQEEAERLARLEERVAAAEARAAEAEAAAARAEQNNNDNYFRVGYYGGWNGYYYPRQPVIVVNGNRYCPPTKPTKPVYCPPGRQPGFQAQFQTGNVNISYSSGSRVVEQRGVQVITTN